MKKMLVSTLFLWLPGSDNMSSDMLWRSSLLSTACKAFL